MNRLLSLLFVFYVSAIPAASALHWGDRDISHVRMQMEPTPASDVGLYLAAEQGSKIGKRNREILETELTSSQLDGKYYAED